MRAVTALLALMAVCAMEAVLTLCGEHARVTTLTAVRLVGRWVVVVASVGLEQGLEGTLKFAFLKWNVAHDR